MRTPDIYISAIGTFLPPITAAPASDPDTMTAAAVAGDIPAVEMALRATRQALERWGRGTDELTLLLYADAYHSGPDGWLPHSYLQRHAVGGHVLAVGVRQGCNGVFGALELAAGYLQTQRADAAAMVVSADNFESPLVDRWTAFDGYCLGDAATALVLSRTPGFAQLRSITSATMPELEELHRAGRPLHPPGVIARRMLEFQPATLAPEVAAEWIKNLREVVTRALDEAGIEITKIARVAVQNSPRKNLDVDLMALGLPESVTTWQYGRSIGHSANDQVLSFEHLLQEGELSAGDHLLMLGLGPGLTFSAAVIEIIDQPAWTRASA